MRKLAISLVFLGLLGCNAQVEDFVSVGENPAVTPPPGGTTPSTPSVQSQDGIKVSPGQVLSASTNMGIKATVTATRQRLTSSNLGMRVGIQKMSQY